MGGVNAQQLSTCGNFCGADLSHTITSWAQDPTDLTYYKPPSSGDCSSTNVPYFDVHYKQNYCDKKGHTDQYDACDPNECVLKIHVYYPTNNDYANCPLPAIILFHGGAYNECGDYNDGGIVALGGDLASRGYVVFNVNYRVGVITDNRLVNNINEDNRDLTFVAAQQILAIYRAVQDARGAIRSIIKMNSDGTFNPIGSHPYKINTDQIFVGGVSAGSLIALAACYFGDGTPGQNRFDAVCPGVRTAFSGTTPNLASLDPPNVYYANRADLSFDFHTHVAGILNCWGSLFIPTANLSQPYDFYKGQGFLLPPIISFCGKLDPVFWYTHQGVYFSPYDANSSLQKNNEIRCVPQSSGYSVTALTDINGDPVPNAYSIGSQDIYKMLHTPGGNNMPVLTEFYLDRQMYHGLDDDCVGCTANPMAGFTKQCDVCMGYFSNFGVAANTNEATTYEYIATRAATFFQTILGGDISHISTTKFVECENNRLKCLGNTTTVCP
ncbi:MAG: alpha/beta hydrolase [Parafilimonas sp.]